MKKGIACALSALCGALIGGLAVRYYERKRCDILIEDANEKATKFYMDKLQEIVYDELPENPPAEDDMVDFERMDMSTPMSPVVQKAYNSMTTTLGYSESDPNVIQGIYEMEDPDLFQNTGRASVLIDHYSDGVFVDEDGSVLTKGDIYAYFGNMEIEKLIDRSESGVIYITNEKLETDYEIADHPFSYTTLKANGDIYDE